MNSINGVSICIKFSIPGKQTTNINGDPLQNYFFSLQAKGWNVSSIIDLQCQYYKSIYQIYPQNSILYNDVPYIFEALPDQIYTLIITVDPITSFVTYYIKNGILFNGKNVYVVNTPQENKGTTRNPYPTSNYPFIVNIFGGPFNINIQNFMIYNLVLNQDQVNNILN